MHMTGTTVPAPVRTGLAAASVLGVIALAGCGSASPADAEEDTASSPAVTTPATATGDDAPDSDEGETSGDPASTGAYIDGTYTAEGSYVTPETVETISVTVTLDDDVITAVEVTGNPTKRESKQYQGQFIGGIADVVVGKSIDEISVSRVAGSSLTSGGFNEAIAQIKDEAAA